MLLFLLAAVLFMSDPSWAASYYVSKSGDNANSCTAAQSIATAKLTIAAALGCESAGDTVWVDDGIYTELSLGSLMTPGTSASNRTWLRAINSRQVTIRPSSSSGTSRVIHLSGKPFIGLSGLVLDAVNVQNDALSLDTSSTDVIADDVELMNSKTQGALVSLTSVRFTLTNSYVHHNGNLVTTPNLWHGAYISASDSLIEDTEFSFNAQMGMQIYRSGGSHPTGVVSRRNYFHDNCQGTSTGSNLVLSYQGNLSDRDTVIVGDKCTTGISLINNTPTSNTVRHASVYCKAGTCSSGINITSGSLNNILQNNIALGFSNNINNNGTSTTLTGNRTSGTATDIWNDPANGDLTLKSGSAAIDAGTDIGLAFNGSSPDQGRYETFTATGGTVTGNAASVQLSMALNTPFSTGTTGWSVNNGRTVTSVSVQGSSTVVIFFDGAACGGGTWEASYDGSGSARDSDEQRLFAVSAISLTNNCTGPAYTFTQTVGAMYEAVFSQETSRLLTYASPGGCFAVRTKFKATGGDPPSITTKLRVATNGENGTYADVPDVFGAANIKYIGQLGFTGLPEHTHPLVLERLTSEFSGMVAGAVQLCFSGCQTPAVDLTQDSESEQVDILCTDNDAGTTTYHFRRYQTDDTALTYGVGGTPSITLTPARSSAMGF